MEKAANTIRQYLGPWGCQCRLIGDYNELAEIAKMAFDVPGRNLFEIARNVERLGKVERSARVREAIRRHWPEPTVLWPANGNARKMLAKR